MMQDVHVKLDAEVMARLREEKQRRGIPVALLVRECVLSTYGGVSSVSEDYRNPVDTTGKMKEESNDAA